MQRNIQTFFPSLPSPATSGPWPPPPAPAPPPPESSTVVRSDSANVAKAVAATAVSSFAFCGLLLFLFQFFVARRRRKETAPVPPAKISPLQRLRSKASLRRSAFVDDDGLDAVYWREINGKGCAHCGRRRFRAGGHVEDGEEEHGGFGEEGASPARSGWRNQEKPLLRAGYVSSSSPSFNVQSPFSPRPAQINQHLPPPPNQRLPLPPGRVTQSATALPPRPPIATSPPPPEPKPNAAPPSPVPPPPVRNSNAAAAPPSPVPPPPVRNSNAAAAPPPPPSPEAQQSAKPPAPPPPPPAAQSSAKPPVPPPPPPAAQPSAKPPVPPPPPPAAKPSAKSPPPPPPRPNNKPPAPGAPPPPPPGRSGGGAPSARPPAGPVPPAAVPTGGKKLKPLHWDKVNAFNIEHSMVWDKINKGSFRVDEDSMEYLFGTIAPKKAASNSSNASTSAGNATAPAQINLLDPRKSQNIAIVLRSIAVNRREIIDGLLEGRGLSNDVLARLTTIAVTKEEEDLVRGYSGDPARLAEAESFLFHILGAVPAPFARLNALLFRDNYGPEAAHLKQSLRTLEEACRELKTPTRGLFLKLLETVLKAGNRMNAGTARGDAQAFNLTALRKLADVKSTDGSTTLLHFVVEEVVRAEGKRLVVNRANSLRRSDSGASGARAALERTPSRAAAREEREFEYTKLGLPIVGGLSDEFVNLKKAAAIDYDALITACPALQARVSEIMRLLEASGGGGRFAREMGAFVERANEELKGIRAEQARVLELVKKTTEYYHPGASKVKDAHPLHLFMVVKDFMDMVDKACIDITRNLQKKKQAAAAARAGSGSGSSGKSQRVPEASERGRRPVAMFPNLPPGFMSANSRSDSSSDDDD